MRLSINANGLSFAGEPALSLRTTTDELPGAEKWSAGPTAVLLKQEHGWTYGALVSHLWSYAGNGQASDVDATHLQPFLSYITAPRVTVS